MRKTLNPTVARVLKRLDYPLDVILTCVRWYQSRAGNTHQDPSEKVSEHHRRTGPSGYQAQDSTHAGI
jgi:hypothetical protein